MSVLYGNSRLAENVDAMEKAMIEMDPHKKESISNQESGKLTTTEEWDNTVVPAAGKPVSESFVIPIDAPDTKTPTSNRQANTYAAKKTVAQGMMDIALITANANQLRYIIEYTSNTKTFYFNFIMIILSLILQVAVGMALIFKGRFDLRGESKMAHARKINNFVVVGVFFVTIINVFIASFTITGTTAVNYPALSYPANSANNLPANAGNFAPNGNIMNQLNNPFNANVNNVNN